MKRILSEDNWKRIHYFKDYYLKSFLVIFMLIIFGVYILYTTIFGYNHPALSVAIVSNCEFNIKDIQQGLEKYLNVDYVEVTHLKNSIDAKRILNMRFVSGDIDIFIAEESIFEQYAQKDVTEELEGYIRDETYEMLKAENLLIEANICEESMDGSIVLKGETKTNGILLSETIENECITGLMLGIVKNDKDKIIKVQAFDYFLEDK